MNILMFAHGGSLNRGCEAIVRSSARMIKQQVDGARIYLASDRPDTDRIIPALDAIYDGSSREIRRYSYAWMMSAFRTKLLNDESYALRKIHHNVIRHIDQADVMLSIGGDNYCYGEQPGWYEIDRRAKARGKKLVLWGCSIGKEDMSAPKLEDLKLFDLILARESITYNMLKNLGLHTVRLVADPAFTMEKEELPLPPGWQAGNTIGLNFSPLVMGLNPDSKKAIRELIRHILQTTDMTIALTPHVIQEGNNDYEVLRQYEEEFRSAGRVILLPDHLTAVQYKGYIARMRMFIGARTHATIAAYSSHVPTMVLGYSVKSRGIARDLFGEEKLVLHLKDLSRADRLKAGFDEMVQEEEAIRKQLQAAIPRIRAMSCLAAEYLKALA